MVNPCKFCNRDFATKQQKEEHELIHEGRKYTCSICNKLYSSLSSLSRHRSTMHELKKDQNTTTLFSVCGKQFLCGACNIFFDSNSEYQQHLDTHMDKLDFGTVRDAKKM